MLRQEGLCPAYARRHRADRRRPRAAREIAAPARTPHLDLASYRGRPAEDCRRGRPCAVFAWVNPLNHDRAREVESVVAAGAHVLMLPMVSSATEAAAFVDLVQRWAVVVLLVERREAVA